MMMFSNLQMKITETVDELCLGLHKICVEFMRQTGMHREPVVKPIRVRCQRQNQRRHYRTTGW
jgi:hypothetical protein